MTRIPLWLITLVIGFVLGFIILKPHQTTIKAHTGAETLSVVVTLHDTLRTFKTVHDVKTSSCIDTVQPCTLSAAVGSVSNVSRDSMTFDTAHCYTINEHEKDGAYIAATLCSRYFTALPPPDLKGIITYQPPPDTQKTIILTDTITHTKMNWSVTAIAACAGVIAGVLVRR